MAARTHPAARTLISFLINKRGRENERGGVSGGGEWARDSHINKITWDKMPIKRITAKYT